MKHLSPAFLQFYQSALRDYLAKGVKPDAKLIEKIGGQVRDDGLSVRGIAELHERYLVMDLLPGSDARKQTSLIRKAGGFFAAVIHAAGMGKEGSPGNAIELLSGRTVELAATNRKLDMEVIKHSKVEMTLRKSERQVLKALEESEAIKQQLRGLSRRFLTVQEGERKKISRELHDVVTQALLGINVRLAALKTEARINTKELGRNIDRTQKMISKSAKIVHQFASELHPVVLDDLGLVPALHSFMKNFTTRTGVHAHLTAFDGIEKLDAVKRTVLYRVAQEALTNVASHAHASHAAVTISEEEKIVRMEVIDDGRSFPVNQMLLAQGTRRIGLLGMRERVEMVGGCFDIESVPGRGTKIIARIPTGKARERRPRSASVDSQPGKL